MRRIVISTLLAITSAGCGYSEDEWQAQLAKYGKLNDKYAQEKSAREKAAEELAALEGQVKDLSQKLEDMGVNVETLSQKLQAEGTEKDRLNADLAQLQQALAEYKARAAQLERIKQRFEQLRDKLQKLTNLGLKVQIRHNRMVISLPGDVLFASGSDKLKDEGFHVLSAVSDVIRNDAQLSKRFFQVAGHTDSKPLAGGKFSDNWGLSAMRARQVLVYLVGPLDAKPATAKEVKGGGGLNARQLHAAGYGETDPVADNQSDAGRQVNRRVELVLMPDVEEMLDLKSLL